VLRRVFGGNAAAGAGSLFAGKLGLALSGGGFRASLFHIGVLAALAERDMLRHVEVLSCVSGGSILGAHYYLEVRKLLQEKSDGEITRADYVALVERLARDFLAGVQENLRVRIGTNLLANLRMLFQPGYTTTTRLAQLYEQHLYARIDDDKERVLRKLVIRPKGDENCVPKYDNWQRASKVPILILNATALNTGHNWQFTASWMGEPPASIDSQVDGNYRLRRMYLDDAPAPHRDAAGAARTVPGRDGAPGRRRRARQPGRVRAARPELQRDDRERRQRADDHRRCARRRAAGGAVAHHQPAAGAGARGGLPRDPGAAQERPAPRLIVPAPEARPRGGGPRLDRLPRPEGDER
jgi:hypothetical protein